MSNYDHYQNVFSQNRLFTRFRYRLLVRTVIVEERDFLTPQDAAWAADKARWLLGKFLRRNRPYNFPEEIEAATEGDLAPISPAVASAFSRLCLMYPDESTIDVQARVLKLTSLYNAGLVFSKTLKDCGESTALLNRVDSYLSKLEFDIQKARARFPSK